MIARSRLLIRQRRLSDAVTFAAGLVILFIAVVDEFVYVLEGHPTLYLDDRSIALAPGMCAGFRHGTGIAHHLVNRSGHDVLYLEIGDRTPGESVTYPDDDLHYVVDDGTPHFLHKDGTPY